MSYLTFHFIFLIPPILLLGLTQPSPWAGVGGRRAAYAIPTICVIAFTYTTPWDNYLVAREVWWYGANRVIGTVGYVPIEEYMFFILQPILTGLFLYQYLARWAPQQRSSSPWAGRMGVAFFVAVSAIGAGLLLADWDSGLYMGLILAWAGPVLAGMWAYAGKLLWALRRPLIITTLLPTVYLWVADATAIHLGIWEISATYSFGFNPLGLPIEEATFFLVTNLMVVQGTLLFLFERHGIIPEEWGASVPAGRSSAQRKG